VRNYASFYDATLYRFMCEKSGGFFLSMLLRKPRASNTHEGFDELAAAARTHSFCRTFHSRGGCFEFHKSLNTAPVKSTQDLPPSVPTSRDAAD
jgi:hypothetical protein